MPTPAKLNLQTSTVSTFSPNEGYQPNTLSQNYSIPNGIVDNPPVLLGVDFVTQIFPIGVTMITFPNLPIRGVGNPNAQTQTQPKTLQIPPGSLLLFEVVSSSGEITVTSNIMDTSNVTYTAAAVGPGNYKTFQAQVTSGTMESATIWGKLWLCQGAAAV